MNAPVHTPADLARFWSHPEVIALRAAAHVVNGGQMTGRERAAAMKGPLNAIRDKVSELKARGV